ncbi:MAG: hypothetical protein WBE37_10630 [Bryobacteraceae bacterium]
MRSFLFSIAGLSLLVFSLTAAAPDRNPSQDENSFHADRDAYFNGEHWHARLFERVKADVEHVRAAAWPRGGDDFRLDKTVAELDQLQSQYAKKVYDDSELQRVIDTLGKVASFNRMPARERKIIDDDINRLRQYRADHADWFREQQGGQPG